MEPFRVARRCWAGIVVWSLAAFLAAWPLLAAPAAAASVLPPGPPTALIGHGGNGQVSLSWKAPAADGVASIAGYDVYQGTSPAGESAVPVNGAVLVKATSYAVTGLTNGTDYYFTVKAVNAAALTSAASSEVGVVPSADPGAPGGLAATAGHAQVSLSWTAPASDGGTAITGYDVYDGTTPGFTDSKLAASVSGTSATVSGLGNGTTYYFRVTAVNAAGEGPASGTASATPVTAVTAPAAPGGLTASPGHAQVRLSWAAPASTPASAGVGGYEVYQGTSPGGESAAPVNGTALVKATSYTVSGLTAGTTYYFKVAAVSRAGQQGTDSNEASATPLPSAGPSPKASATISAPKPGEAAPGAPGAPAPPSGLSASASSGQVSLAWIAPASDGGSRITGYHVYQGTTRGFSSRTPVKSVTTGTSVTLTGLADGTTYYYVVTAVNARGTMSLPSGEVAAKPARTAGRVSKTVIISLAAVAVGATVGALALGLRRRRPHPRPPLAPAAAVPAMPGGHAVQAVPDPGRPALVGIRDIGPEEMSAVRLETCPGTMITTIEEIGS